MAPSKLSQEERARRKRENARIRQRRCRAKKKQLAELMRKQEDEQKAIKPNIPSRLTISPKRAVPALLNSEDMERSAFTPVKEGSVTQKLPLDPCPDGENLRPSTPARSHEVPIVSLVGTTPHSVTNFPEMPPLPNASNGNSSKAVAESSSVPPSHIAESELTAIDAMLSMRTSPVPESSRLKGTPSPRTIATASSNEVSKEASLRPSTTKRGSAPFLPEMGNTGWEKKELEFRSRHDTRPSLSPTEYNDFTPIAPKQDSVYSQQINYDPYKLKAIMIGSREEVAGNNRSLSPGVYFYYN